MKIRGYKNPWVWVITFKILSTTGKPETIPSGSINSIVSSKTSLVETTDKEGLKSSLSGDVETVGVRSLPTSPDDERKVTIADVFDHKAMNDMTKALRLNKRRK